MAENRDFQDLIGDPVFMETLGNIIRGIAKAQGGEDGKSPEHADVAIDALHFALAALLEADTANPKPGDLRRASEKSGRTLNWMMRIMRAMSDVHGRHMLELLGGQIMPDKLN